MFNTVLIVRGFTYVFSRRTTGFHRRAKLFDLNLYKKNFPLDGQTRQAKLSPDLVNLPGTQPLMKPLDSMMRK